MSLHSKNVFILKEKHLTMLAKSDDDLCLFYDVQILTLQNTVIAADRNIVRERIPDWLNDKMALVNEYHPPKSIAMCGGRSVGRSHRLKSIEESYKHILSFENNRLISD